MYSSNRRMGQRREKKSTHLIVPLLSLVGLYWFSVSFFLAKRSLPLVSTCDEARVLLQDVLSLSREETNLIVGDDYNSSSSSNGFSESRKGCWLPRRVDSLVVLVVDALRFDFARDHLPMSVGARISPPKQGQQNSTTTSSQLLQFVADPPTVTMQRLKGLTTGSLPTFADISGNMVCSKKKIALGSLSYSSRDRDIFWS